MSVSLTSPPRAGAVASEVRAPAGLRTLSVVIPALNEQENLGAAIENVIAAVEPQFQDYQIIIVNDGSTDRTPQIAADWARSNPRIEVVTHARPSGFGASYHAGRRRARMQYCVMIHGDNAFDRTTLTSFLSHAGRADVICGYIANPESRSGLRRLISALYTAIVNLLFTLRLRYYNGLQIHDNRWLQTVSLESTGFGFQAELLLTALREGKSFRQVPTCHQERLAGGKTKIFKWKNMITVLGTLLRLKRRPGSPRKDR